MKKKTLKSKTTVKAKQPIKSLAASKRRVTKKSVASKAKKTSQPKGIKHHAKRLYRITPKFIHGMIVGAFVGIVVLVPLGKTVQTSALSISSGQDCDNYSIIKCGVSSTNDLLSKYRASHYIQAAYANMGISSADISSMGTTAVSGTVFDNGTVRVNGKVVAKNVSTEARLRVTSNDNRVTSGGYTFYTRFLASSWSHSSAPAYVVMKNNVFQFAILAPCGNPITGTPTTSPPKQVPNITVCDLATLKVISIKENAFNTNTQSKNLADCTPPPGTIVVCELATKMMVSIKENTFDTTKYSKNAADCQPVVLAQTTLPNTGPGAILIVFGLSILGGYAFHMRHRHVQHKKRAHHARHAAHHTN